MTERLLYIIPPKTSTTRPWFEKYDICSFGINYFCLKLDIDHSCLNILMYFRKINNDLNHIQCKELRNEEWMFKFGYPLIPKY